MEPRTDHMQNPERILWNDPDFDFDLGPSYYWVRTKPLGGGSFGNVWLWEWNGPRWVTQPQFTLIAEKVLPTGSSQHHSLYREGKIMEPFCYTISPHVVKLLQKGITEVDGEYEGRTPYLYMEFCRNGSLQDALDRRIKTGKPFSESTLWRIFKCLVEGLSLLQYGTEIATDPKTRGAEVLPLQNWKEIIHFDLKPDNSMYDYNTLYPC
jgi:serine/threonine protein kinase